MDRMKTVVLTGANGFIGKFATRSLLGRGYEVHCLLRSTDNCTLPAQCVIHQLDLFDYQSLKELFNNIRPTYLLHLAWDVSDDSYMQSPRNIQWVAASLELIFAFRECGGKRAVFAGTCAEYDWSYEYLREGITPLVPFSVYGKAKLALSDLVNVYCKQANIEVAWGRIFHLFGPWENPKRLIPSIMASIINKTRFEIKCGGIYRDYLYVEDVADAFATVLDSAYVGVVNVASGVPVQLSEIYRNILEIAVKDDVSNIVIENQANDYKTVYAAVDILQNTIKWKPRWTLKEGLQETYRWWERRIQNG